MSNQPTLDGLTGPIPITCGVCLGFTTVRVPLRPVPTPFGTAHYEPMTVPCPACHGTGVTA